MGGRGSRPVGAGKAGGLPNRAWIPPRSVIPNPQSVLAHTTTRARPTHMSMQWPPKVNTMLENAWKNASTPGGGARAALATVRGCQLAQDMPIMYHAV